MGDPQVKTHNYNTEQLEFVPGLHWPKFLDSCQELGC